MLSPKTVIISAAVVALIVIIGKSFSGQDNDKPRPPLAPTVITETGLDSVKIVSAEPMNSLLPGLWKVEFAGASSDDIQLAFVADSIPRTELVQGKWLKIVRYHFHPNRQTMRSPELYVGTPASK